LRFYSNYLFLQDIDPFIVEDECTYPNVWLQNKKWKQYCNAQKNSF